MPASRFLKSGPSFVCTLAMWFLKRYRFVNVINIIIGVDVVVFVDDVIVVVVDFVALVVVVDDSLLLL